MSRVVICGECGQEKKHKAFGLCGKCYQQTPERKASMRAAEQRWYATHADQKNADDYQKRKRRDPERLALRGWENHLRKMYGLTLEEGDAIRNSPCGICGALPPSDIDHDHETGRVRGPLCHACNMDISVFDRRTNDWITRAREWVS